MGAKTNIDEERGLLPATSRDSHESLVRDFLPDVQLDEWKDVNSIKAYTHSLFQRWWTRQSPQRRSDSNVSPLASILLHPARRCRPRLARLCRWLALTMHLLIIIIIVCGIFFPSYSHPPQRYIDLQDRVKATSTPGAANPGNEKVFIAASLWDEDGTLVSGKLGRSLRSLIHMLGPENVFLSIYENDVDNRSKRALHEFGATLTCNISFVTEHLHTSKLHHVTTPKGFRQLKRVAFLAEVRNRALAPLDDERSSAFYTRWDKLLYLNDVAFNPVDAANLLLSTNVNERTGKTSYRAACAVDFIDPFKFYDTFATRDFEGYQIGLPFYPWFTSAGQGQSRKDVLNQADAVRVKSCWGGLVAFEAKWFQPHLYESRNSDLITPETQKIGSLSLRNPRKPNDQIVGLQQRSVNGSDDHSIPPLRFRFEPELYWEASECCLIHADLERLPFFDNSESPIVAGNQDKPHHHIYMNPYIRVAYSNSVFFWLSFTSRFERLYTPVHSLLNFFVHMPRSNARRLQAPGDEVEDRVWTYNDMSLKALREGKVKDLPSGLLQGSYEWVRREAQAGMFCGTRKLQYMKDSRVAGEKNWVSAKVPSVD